MAQCVVTAATVTCASTTTSDTTNAGGSPAVDRHYPVDTSGAAFTGTVSSGALIDGFGLAFTNTVGGANALNVVNNGTIQIDVGNAATAGGTAAVNINGVGPTDINYSGSGDVLNLGTGGSGLDLRTSGTGNIVANVGGDVTSAPGGNGIYALNSGTSGDVTITTAADTLVSADLVGVFAEVTAPTSDGDISITNNADIGSLAGPGDITHGVAANNYGTGSITIQNNGAIGSSTDVPIGAGVLGQIFNIASTGDVTLSNTGDIYVFDAAIAGYNDGEGGISIENSGALTSTDVAGIYAQQAGTGTTGEVVVTNSGAIDAGTHGIQTSNAGTGGVSITNDGAITAVGMGIRARGLSALQTGNILVEGTGTIDSGDTGIWAATAGTGDVTVDYTGAIGTTGATGVDVDATTGAATVTLGAVTAATNAVDVTSTGDQNITLTGVTTGTAGSGLVTTSTGARTIVVNAGGNVTGGTQAILIAGAGTASVDNLGTIGDDSATVAINASAAGATTINNDGTINGVLTLSAFDDALINNGTLNSEGVIDFGAGAADDFSNDADGTFNLTGDTTLVNLESFSNDGLIDLGTFTLTGPAIAFVNEGVIDTDGDAGVTGFTTFDNDGTIDLGPGTFTVIAGMPFNNTGTIMADEGAATITGQTSFANSGTLDLQDGVTDDVLTINSDFAGSGDSTLAVDFDGNDSDLLIINGAASGSTAVDANFLGGPLINLDGSLVVDATTSTDDAFVLGTVTGATPLVDVSLVQDGADFFLVTAPTDAAFEPLAVPGFAADIWYQSADEVFAETRKPATTVGASFWGNGYISRNTYGDRNGSVTIEGEDFDVDNRLKTRRYGAQLGADYGFGGGRIGLTGGYGSVKTRSGGDLKADGWNLGVYGQFGGLTGFHGEFLAKHDRYKGEFDGGVFKGEKFDIRANGIDGSLGYRFGMGGAATVDVHAGVSRVRTKVDDVNAFGFNYDIATVRSTRGRAGVRAILGGSFAPYVDATVYREFDGDSRVELFDGGGRYKLDNNGKATWVRIEGGLSGNNGPGPILAVWGDVGDRKGLGLRAGWRFGGTRLAEVAPPPPPVYVPPPAAAPATQTCADGSVILASDMCPPAPEPYVPPPPPPAEPERG